MNRRRTFLIVFVVLILILVVGVVALLSQRQRGGEGVIVEEGIGPMEEGPTPVPETERVVVALQTIPRGMRIPPDAIELRDWPIDNLPDDPIRYLDNVVGMVARVEIPSHQPVSASMVKKVYLGEGSEMSLAIPKGKVAIAVPVMAISAVANAIRPNDRVDVLISFSIIEVDQDSQIKLPIFLSGGEDCLAGCQVTGEGGQIPRLVTQYSIQNALVMGVGLWVGEQPDITTAPSPGEEGEEGASPLPVAEGEEAAAAPAPVSVVEGITQLTIITLAVSPQDALVLKWAWESNTSMDLVMRSASDSDIYAQPEAVTMQYMIDRFQISLPPKLPHSPENVFEYRLIKEAEERIAPQE